MAEHISALTKWPIDCVRQVTPGVLGFYVDELSGLYLPDDFTERFRGNNFVEGWDVADRLKGKFGRFTLSGEVPSDVDVSDIEEIIIMGTTLPLGKELNQLRHRSLPQLLYPILKNRDLLGRGLSYEKTDYGDTEIVVDGRNVPQELRVFSESADFGRADADGRERTCEVLRSILAPLAVMNVELEPSRYSKIIPPGSKV